MKCRHLAEESECIVTECQAKGLRGERDRLRTALKLVTDAWRETFDCSLFPGHYRMHQAVKVANALLYGPEIRESDDDENTEEHE